MEDIEAEPSEQHSDQFENDEGSPVDNVAKPGGKTDDDGHSLHALNVDQSSTSVSGPACSSARKRIDDSKVRRGVHSLPLCKVCALQATGFHYGINSCEACKGFFRRSLVRKTSYICLKSDKCILKPGKRNVCGHCRYKRCLEAGMSVQGIKIGRYTYEKRTKDLLELRELHIQNSIVKQEAYDQERRDTIEDFIEKVRQAQLTHYPDFYNHYKEIPYLKEQYKKEPDSKQGTVPLHEFLEVLMKTGIPLDDRIDMLNNWMINLEHGLKNMVKFAKDIPGFKQLSISDQMNLIKHSVCEMWVMARHKAFDVEYGMFSTFTGYTLDILKVLGDDFGHEIMRLVGHAQALELTADEIILLKAYVLFFTDRCELECPEAVETIQFKIQEAIEYSFRQNHPDEKHMFCKLVIVLRDMRTVTYQYEKYMDKLKLFSTSGDLALPPLFFEVIS